MAPPTGAERRRFPRKPQAAGWEVSCTREMTADANLSLRLIDLSPGGASLETIEALEKGNEVTLSMTVLGNADRFRAQAAVMWASSIEVEGTSRHMVGLRFLRVLESKGDTFGFITGATSSGPTDPRRRGKRFVPPGAAVEINTPGLLARLGIGKTSTRIQDLGRSGIRIATSRELVPGSRLTLVIELLRPAVRLVTPGEVKWCRREEGNGKNRWSAGIAFVELTPEDEEVLRTVDKFYLA